MCAATINVRNTSLVFFFGKLLIEKTIRSNNQSTELKFIREYSLEHVMPKKWRNNWDKDKNDELFSYVLILHRLSANTIRDKFITNLETRAADHPSFSLVN